MRPLLWQAEERREWRCAWLTGRPPFATVTPATPQEIGNMRAAVCLKPFQVALQEAPDPTPAADEVVVRVRATGVCGSDVRGYQGIHPEIANYPIILGHEFAGEIAAIGGESQGWRVGQRVAVEPLSVCERCPACLRGDYHLCEHLRLNGHHYPGSFAEYTTAKKRFTYALPETVSFEQGAMLEPLAVCVHAIRVAQVKLGDFVVVLGGGTIGQLAAQCAQAAGGTVLLSDPFAFKRELALSCGIPHVIDPNSEALAEAIRAHNSGNLADVVVEAAGTQDTLAESVRLARKGGTIVAIGFTAKPEDRISLTLVTIRELRFLGSVIYNQDFPRALALAEQGRVNLEPLITVRSSLPDTERAITTVIERSDSNVKSMIFP